MISSITTCNIIVIIVMVHVNSMNVNLIIIMLLAASAGPRAAVGGAPLLGASCRPRR